MGQVLFSEGGNTRWRGTALMPGTGEGAGHEAIFAHAAFEVLLRSSDAERRLGGSVG